MESALVNKLTEFGFTQNESKAYLTLLKRHPSSGYEVSQYSGVPRSAIYDILHKLELGGIVYAEGKKPVQYIPISPDQLTTNLASRFEHNINELKEGLNELNQPLKRESTWNLKLSFRAGCRFLYADFLYARQGVIASGTNFKLI